MLFEHWIERRLADGFRRSDHHATTFDGLPAVVGSDEPGRTHDLAAARIQVRSALQHATAHHGVLDPVRRHNFVLNRNCAATFLSVANSLVSDPGRRQADSFDAI